MFSLTYIYQKDERALPGNHPTHKFISFPWLNAVFFTTPHSFSSSHPLGFKGLIYLRHIYITNVNDNISP